MDLRHIEVPKKMLKNVAENRKFNEVIEGYYRRLIEESEKERKRTLQNNLDNLHDCNRNWYMDQYTLAKVKDFKKTNLCKDKFCSNCKKVKQASRMARFMPEIEEQLKIHPHAYQMVLTVPNVSGDELERTIKRMSKSAAMLMQYLNGSRKTKWLSIGRQSVGAIRTLEITYKSDSYHPHFHLLLLLDKPTGEKIHSNVYGYNKYERKEVRQFSDFEIKIQKMWRMIYDGIRLTEKNYNELELGYSCMVDEMNEGDYLELFKYMVKGETEDKRMMSYSQFKVLHHALKHVRQIQGYGVFHNIQDDDSIDDLVDEIYNAVIEMLQEKEKPEFVYQTISDLLEDNEYTLISRKRIHQYLKNL